MPRGCGRRSAAGGCRSRRRAICPPGPRPPTPPGTSRRSTGCAGGSSARATRSGPPNSTTCTRRGRSGCGFAAAVTCVSSRCARSRSSVPARPRRTASTCPASSPPIWPTPGGRWSPAAPSGSTRRATGGALAAGGATVAVVASGIDVPYPRGHDTLFDRIAHEGLLVTEWPPGAAPTRLRFLVRNRVIAALTRGTVVVEAAARSGALNTARHARGLGRLVMAVPGPVTSPMSVGCHRLLREGATCVTRAGEVVEEVGAIGELALPLQGPARPRDHLDATTRRVLEAVPVRRGAGPASIAVVAGVDATTVGRCLGALWAEGLVERVTSGWRLTAAARGTEAPQ